MKIVRESIEFERGLEPKQALSLGKRALIKKWFDDLGYGPDKYIINADLSVEVRVSLYLYGTKITLLPDNLSVGEDLYLTGSNITSLPDNLSVEGSLYLAGTQITSLPDNLCVGGYLDLAGTNITSLPDNLNVRGGIFKDF